MTRCKVTSPSLKGGRGEGLQFMKKTYQSPETSICMVELAQAMLQVSGGESLEGTSYGRGSRNMDDRSADTKERTGTWEDLMW